MMAEQGFEGWGEYTRLTARELERLEKALKEANEKLDRIRTDDMSLVKVEIATLKVKAGMWGAVAGAIPALVAILWYLFTKG